MNLMDEPQGETVNRGPIVVVTGAGSGIGRAVAARFAAAGSSLLVHTGHRAAAAAETCDLVRSQGVSATPLVADLASDAGQDRLLQLAWEQYGHVDVWVNSAGVDILTGKAAAASFEEKLEALWQVDVRATIRLSRGVGRCMQTRGSGVIINVGWDQAEQGMAGDSGEMFAATKGAIMAFSRSLAQSLAPHVRVNCVAPGWIKTAWGEQASATWQKRAADESLVGRWGTAADVAEAVYFLATPQAAFINGQVIAVNGGWRRSPASVS